MLEETAGPRGGRGDALLAVTREDLDLFGVSELEDRIELLESELARVRGGHHVLQARAQVDTAGVVDEAGQPSQSRVHFGEHAQHVVFAGDVGLHGDGPPARVTDALHDLRSGVCPADVIDCNGMALGRREEGGGRADAAAATRHQENLLQIRLLQETRGYATKRHYSKDATDHRRETT